MAKVKLILLYSIIIAFAGGLVDSDQTLTSFASIDDGSYVITPDIDGNDLSNVDAACSACGWASVFWLFAYFWVGRNKSISRLLGKRIHYPRAPPATPSFS
jgi:hypothetical protein